MRNRWLTALLLGLAALAVSYAWISDHLYLSSKIHQLERELRRSEEARDARTFRWETLQSSNVRLIQERDRLKLRAALKAEPIVVTGTTVEGEPLDWSAYRGKLVVLHCWSAGCCQLVCPNPFPELKKLYAQYHPRGVQLISLSQDPAAEREEAARFLKEQEISWTALLPTASDRPLVNGLFVEWPMTLIVVGEDGRCVAVIDTVLEQEREKNSMEAVLRPLRLVLQAHESPSNAARSSGQAPIGER